MLKKIVTYKDLDGNDITGEFYFNLSVAELAEMEMYEESGLSTKLAAVAKGGNPQEIIKTFKMILEKAVGRRSEDGRRFVKDQEAIDNFMQTDAYSVVFMELLTDAQAAAQFIIGCVPKDLSDKLAGMDLATMTTVQLPENVSITGNTQASVTTDLRTKEKALSDYSREELLEMPSDQFRSLIDREKGNVPKEVLVIAMQRASSQH